MNESEEEEITQDEVDEIFAYFKVEWDKKVQESGRSEGMYITLSPHSSRALMAYKEAKDEAESRGFTVPDLFPGLKITIEAAS